jgi:hypothetical protein
MEAPSICLCGPTAPVRHHADDTYTCATCGAVLHPSVAYRMTQAQLRADEEETPDD